MKTHKYNDNKKKICFFDFDIQTKKPGDEDYQIIIQW
jgi:hypothetical protein